MPTSHALKLTLLGSGCSMLHSLCICARHPATTHWPGRTQALRVDEAMPKSLPGPRCMHIPTAGGPVPTCNKPHTPERAPLPAPAAFSILYNLNAVCFPTPPSAGVFGVERERHVWVQLGVAHQPSPEVGAAIILPVGGLAVTECHSKLRAQLGF